MLQCCGVQEEGAARKAASEPLLKVPFTAELGNVTPVLVAPGPWTDAEMATAAKGIAFGTQNNAGCNCLSPKVIVMAAEWPQVRCTATSCTVATPYVVQDLHDRNIDSIDPPHAFQWYMLWSCYGSAME